MKLPKVKRWYYWLATPTFPVKGTMVHLCYKTELPNNISDGVCGVWFSHN